MANKYKVPILVTIDTATLGDLIARLRDVDRKAAPRALKKGVNEVTKLVLKAAKAKVPTRTGALKKSLGRFVKTSRDGKVIYGVVKPRAGVWMADVPGLVGRRRLVRGKRRVFVQKFTLNRHGPGFGKINPVKYAHLVEHGRAVVTRKKKKVLAGGGIIYGTRVKMVAARPFMAPAWEQYKSQATGIIGRFVNEEFRKFWEKSRTGRTGRGRGRSR